MGATLCSRAPRLAGGFLLVCGVALASSVPVPAASEGNDREPALSSTFDSKEALARAVLEAFAEEDVETLKRLPLSKDEFRLYVWPRLPASRPERGVPLEYAWGELDQKSRSAVASSFSRYKGRRLELVSVRFQGEVTDYGSFRVHRQTRLRVRDESGDELTLALFGSVMEWSGRYKLWSYVTD